MSPEFLTRAPFTFSSKTSSGDPIPLACLIQTNRRPQNCNVIIALIAMC